MVDGRNKKSDMNNVVSLLIFFSAYDLLSHQGISIRDSRNGCTITYIINP